MNTPNVNTTAMMPTITAAAASVAHLNASCPPPVLRLPLQFSSASRRTAGAVLFV